MLLNSWLDRDLGIAGRVMTADGSSRPRRRAPGGGAGAATRVHLDRDVNDTGLSSTRSSTSTRCGAAGHRRPASSPNGSPTPPRSTRPTWWELCLYDVQGAAVLGGDVSLLASGRLDNQVSCWAATTSLAASRSRRHGVDDRPQRPRGGRVGEHAPAPRDRSSSTCSNGSSPRAAAARDDLLRALSASTCVSADNAHAVHPNYPERHEPEPPPARQRRPGDQAQRQPAVRDLGRDGGGVPAGVRTPPACRGRSSCRATTCRAARRSGRSPRPGSGSPPSTSACRSCRCTRPASCAASHDPAWLASALAAYFDAAPSDAR